MQPCYFNLLASILWQKLLLVIHDHMHLIPKLSGFKHFVLNYFRTRLLNNCQLFSHSHSQTEAFPAFSCLVLDIHCLFFQLPPSTISWVPSWLKSSREILLKSTISFQLQSCYWDIVFSFIIVMHILSCIKSNKIVAFHIIL